MRGESLSAASGLTLEGILSVYTLSSLELTVKAASIGQEEIKILWAMIFP